MRRSFTLKSGRRSHIPALFQYVKPLLLALLETIVCHFFNIPHGAGLIELALVVVYAYHPNARTLSEAHGLPKYPTFQPHHLSRSQLKTRPEPIPERTLWSYIVQIASAIKTVHDAGMAVRTVEVTKVLLTGQNRCVRSLFL